MTHAHHSFCLNDIQFQLTLSEMTSVILGTLALEMQHTRTQPQLSPVMKPNSSPLPVIKQPKISSKLQKKLSWKNTRQTPLDESMSLEVHSVARKPSIGAVPDSFEASHLISSRSSSEDSDTQPKCDVCGNNCIEKQSVPYSIIVPDFGHEWTIDVVGVPGPGPKLSVHRLILRSVHRDRDWDRGHFRGPIVLLNHRSLDRDRDRNCRCAA